ncbi:MAG: hypothetical protein PHX20_07435 [Candidatus Omnitrophica bacterium]|nr:hypothetical protein [Candidatus Omnitrophota bacterium]MDD5437359.1 hypothetical protein [Candidatus Omnitrophota bacterium]
MTKIIALLRQSMRKLRYGYAEAFCPQDSCEALPQIDVRRA